MTPQAFKGLIKSQDLADRMIASRWLLSKESPEEIWKFLNKCRIRSIGDKRYKFATKQLRFTKYVGSSDILYTTVFKDYVVRCEVRGYKFGITSERVDEVIRRSVGAYAVIKNHLT